MRDPRETPGSRWWKFDFHTHTPASNDYASMDVTPEEWLQHARDAGLDGVVVTDHNSGGWIDRLKEVNDRMNQQAGIRPLTIFPGVEITVADSTSRVHLLAIFDPSCDGQKITAVLGSCGITAHFGDHDQLSTSTGFGDTVNRIKQAGGVPIPAHIDGKKGLLENNCSGGMSHEVKKSLTQVYAIEVCQSDAFDQANSSLKQELDRLAQVVGSDAHKPEDIGKRSRWLKMSHPTLEGVRLALTDHPFCVKNQAEDPNTLPEIYLKQLTISKMLYCGMFPPARACVIPFHPHFNAFIGGRGSGKSTLVESIRIVSRRDDELNGLKKLSDDLKRFNSKEGVMRDETELSLEIQRRSSTYRLRWRFSGAGSVVEECTADGWQAVEQGEIQERFPLRIYSQKQIFELASNPRGLLEIMDRSPRIDRGAWVSRWESAKSRFLELRVRQRELQRQLAKESDVHQSPGGYFHRIGASKRQMTTELLSRLFQQRSQTRIIRFDEQAIAMVGKECLCKTLWEKFKTSLSPAEDEEFLLKLKLLVQDEEGAICPSVTGILLASKRPEIFLSNAFIQAVCYRGTDRNGAYQLDAMNIVGPLDIQIHDACKFVEKNMRIHAIKAPARQDMPQYAMQAVFEAVVNAVAHRDYSVYGSKIRLHMFSDRIELFSPGTIPNTMTIESLPLRQAARNELISSLLARCPMPFREYSGERRFLMDKRGEGVPIILTESEKISGRRPVYRLLDDAELLLTIYAANPENAEGDT